MPIFLLALGAAGLTLLGSKQAQAAALAVKYRVQSMLWSMHMLRTGGFTCDYTRTEVKEFETEAEARALYDKYAQQYSNPPMSFAQLLKVAYVPGQAFTEQATVIAESGGERNKPGPCAPPPSSVQGRWLATPSNRPLVVDPDVGYSFFEQPAWRFFRMTLNGRTLFQRGPVLMKNAEAMNEKMQMMQAALNRGSLAVAEQFDWSGSSWHSV